MPGPALRTIAQNGLLLLASLLLALGLGEVALRRWMPQIFPVHPPGLYTTDAEIGYVLTPGFHGRLQRAEYDVPVHVNRAGLRGEEIPPRSDTTFRLLVLGDSQAFGAGVRDDETFSVQLNQLLEAHFPARDIQVLNGGVPGYGTADQLAFLQHRGRELQPEMIVLQFLSVNDFSDNRVPASRWAGVENGMLVDTTRQAASRCGWQFLSGQDLSRWLKRHSHLAYLVSNRAGHLAMQWGLTGGMTAAWGEDFSPEDAQQTGELLQEVARTARALSAECIFLYTTGQAHVIADTLQALPSAAVVEAAAAQVGVTWIDGRDRLRRRNDRNRLYYPLDGHWTAAGHRAVAEILFEELTVLLTEKYFPD